MNFFEAIRMVLISTVAQSLESLKTRLEWPSRDRIGITVPVRGNLASGHCGDASLRCRECWC